MSQGFTFLEILLVVALLAIVTMIAMKALNPVKQLGDTRNAQRRSDIITISEALYQYTVDNGGTVPTDIPQSDDCFSSDSYEICRTGSSDCTGLVDLSYLTDQQKYLVEIPYDPDKDIVTGNKTGYHVVRNMYGRIQVCAPYAEQEAVLSFVR